jgi:hypothetical protein
LRQLLEVCMWNLLSHLTQRTLSQHPPLGQSPHLRRQPEGDHLWPPLEHLLEAAFRDHQPYLELDLHMTLCGFMRQLSRTDLLCRHVLDDPAHSRSDSLRLATHVSGSMIQSVLQTEEQDALCATRTRFIMEWDSDAFC